MLYGKQIRADSRYHVLGGPQLSLLSKYGWTIPMQYKRVDSLQKLLNG